jgi:hypothetical protein
MRTKLSEAVYRQSPIAGYTDRGAEDVMTGLKRRGEARRGQTKLWLLATTPIYRPPAPAANTF